MKKILLWFVLITLSFIVIGCEASNRYPGYYSSGDSWDFNYDSKLGSIIEFSAGEANAYLRGKYLASYVIKGYVYRIADGYIYLKDKKTDDDYILIDLDNSDITSIDYEQTIYVKINSLYKILANYKNAEIIHENDIEEYYKVVTVKELIKLEQLLETTKFIVYGKVDSSIEMEFYDGEIYYLTTIKSTKNGYVLPGKIYDEGLSADFSEKIEDGTYVKVSCSGDNILGTNVGLTNCTILGKGIEYKDKVDLES